MWTVLCLGLTFGLLASSWASSTQDVKIRGCSHVGVFFIQGNDRHSLNFTEAQHLCEALGATLASPEQMLAAFSTGLEICRYGWISDGNVTIARQTSNSLCRAGQTGVIIFRPQEDQYDAFCYDDSDTSDKNCTHAINLESTADPAPKIKDYFTTPHADDHTDAPNSTAIQADSDLADEDKNTTLPIDLSDVKTHTTTISYGDQETQREEDTQSMPFEITPGSNEGSTIESFTEQMTTSVSGQEGIGSGMGEPVTEAQNPTGDSHDTPMQPPTGGSRIPSLKDTTTDSLLETDSENEVLDPEPSDVDGRMMLPPAEDKSDSGSTDWLIIVGVIVAVAAILLVCAAVATRKRWCGKSQTLMITSKSNSEGNGTAASAGSSRAQEREQEMVTLMNKEKVQENGNTEEFTVITLEESPEKNQQA